MLNFKTHYKANTSTCILKENEVCVPASLKLVCSSYHNITIILALISKKNFNKLFFLSNYLMW